MIAILLGVSRELLLHWPQISFATLGTPLLWLAWGWFGRTPLERLWPSVSLPWPMSGIYDLCFRAVFGALMVQPILVIFLFFDRAFNWVSILRTFLIMSISFPLIVAEPWSLWTSPQMHTTYPSVLLILFSFPAVFTFLGLLASAWIGCPLPLRSRNSRDKASATA